MRYEPLWMGQSLRPERGSSSTEQRTCQRCREWEQDPGRDCDVRPRVLHASEMSRARLECCLQIQCGTVILEFEGPVEA